MAVMLTVFEKILSLGAALVPVTKQVLEYVKPLSRLLVRFMDPVPPIEESSFFGVSEVRVRMFRVGFEGLRQIRQTFNGLFSPILDGRLVKIALDNVPAGLNQRIDSLVKRH